MAKREYFLKPPIFDITTFILKMKSEKWKQMAKC